MLQEQLATFQCLVVEGGGTVPQTSSILNACGARRKHLAAGVPCKTDSLASRVHSPGGRLRHAPAWSKVGFAAPSCFQGAVTLQTVGCAEGER